MGTSAMPKLPISLTLLSVLVLLTFTGQAHAYLDPGTGSMILQAVVGSIAAGLVVIKLYWQRLKNFFLHGSSRAEPPGEGPPRKNNG